MDRSLPKLLSGWAVACLVLNACAEDGTSEPSGGGGEIAQGGGSGGRALGGLPNGSGGNPSEDGGTGGSAGAPQDPPTIPLKVMTFNVWNQPISVVAQDVIASEADVVGLQEVTPSEAAELVEELGATWHFVQEDRDNTFAIISRFPILQRIGVTVDTRGGIGATLEVTPQVRAHVFTSHGMWTEYGPYLLGVDGETIEDVIATEQTVRMPALSELLLLTAPLVDSEDATFLTGDFNAPSHLDYEPQVDWPTSIAAHEAGFIDSYAELHPDNVRKFACEFAIDDPGITWTQIPEEEPNGCFDRIDFVFYSAGDADPVASNTIDVAASDHRAVLTRFDIPIPRPGTAPRLQLPRNGATGVSRHPLLAWTSAQGAEMETIHLSPEGGEPVTVSTTQSHLVPPLLLAATTYEIRVESATAEGTVSSETWTFTTAESGGLQPDKASYSQGETIVVTFDGADQSLDWIGLYASSAAYGSASPSSEWKYTNNSAAPPGAVVASGSITLDAPNLPGNYALRFFDNDGYLVEDEIAISVE